MPTASQLLTQYATSLKYEQIPVEVVERAKDCIIDTVAACVLGAHMPWTQIVIEYAKRNSATGGSNVLGMDTQLRAPFACLCNGAAAHAFELDALCNPVWACIPARRWACRGWQWRRGAKNPARN